jgi:nucleoid-associated protein YgaU
MNRYQFLIQKRLDAKRKRLRYNSNLPPKIEKSIDDIYIISRVGDRLDQLAYEYYSDQNLWWVIAQANNIGKGTLAIDPGIRIRIPVQIDYNKLIDESNNAR